MTWNRMVDLVEMSGDTYKRDLFNLGMTIATAQHDPKRLSELAPTKAMPKYEDVHPMLRAPKKS